MSWTRTPGPSLVSDEGVSPQFYNNNTAMVYAPSGGTAAIECQVKNLGDRVVSFNTYLYIQLHRILQCSNNKMQQCICPRKVDMTKI